ncbi:MAG: alpha/beta fold hydrolase [Chakrabartia sp.]
MTADRDFSWQADGLGGIRQRFVQANGIRFELAEAGDPASRRLALCLHGFPELNYSWRFQMPLLADQGWRVWAPNSRGYGASDRPGAVRDYGLDHLTADVGALIDAAAGEGPVDEVMILAHDWGAIIAWAYAILHGQGRFAHPLTKLVIMNVPHPKVMQRELKRWEQLRKSWYIFFFQLPGLPERYMAAKDAAGIRRAFYDMAVDKSRFGKEVLNVYARAAQQPGAMTAMINYYRALLRYREAVDLGDAQVKVPTLMVWGEEDAALGLGCTVGTEQWVPGLELHRLPHVSHWVQQEAPDQVNAILVDWLARG